MGHDQPVSAAGRWLRPQAVLLVGIAAAVLLGLLPGGPHAAAAPERVRVVVELGVAEGPVEVAPSGSRADIDPSPADPGQAQVSARLERAAAAEVSRERVGVRVAARLASDLAGAAQVAHRLDALPYLIVDVAADRLPDLAALPEVAGVSEDEVLRPLLADSVPLVGVTGTPGTTEEPVTVAGQPLTGAGTTVAVIDTGVRATHELLVDRLVGEACFVSGDGTCPNGEDEQIGEGSAAALDTEDDLVGHGTHVSGIAVGSRVEGGQVPQGVAPEAGLLAIQVFQPGERGPASNRSDLLRALDWLITEREEGRLGSLVAINLSLGTEDVASCPTEGGWADIDTAAARLNDLDVLTIAAAGNDGATGAMGLPACLPNVISVAATRPDDPTAIASSSNVSAETDLAAPGVGITSASSLEDDSYVARSGSSMAAPHVAGAVALLRQAAPHATAEQLLAALTTGEPLSLTRDDVTIDTIVPLAVRRAATALPAADAAPATPDSPTLAATAAGQLTVGWSPGAGWDDADPEVTVHAVADPGGHTCSAVHPAATCDLTGLEADEAYRVTLTATSDGATSAASPPSEQVTVRAEDQPDAPTEVTTERGDAEVTVRWDAPGYLGSSPLTGYTVDATRVDDDTPLPQVCTAPASQTTCTAAVTTSGLELGVEYTFTVAAANDAGTATSTASTAVVVAGLPATPTQVTATQVTDAAALEVSWTPPEDGSAELTRQRAVVTRTDTGEEVGDCEVDGDGTECQVAELPIGVELEVRVTATNAIGTGPASLPVVAELDLSGDDSGDDGIDDSSDDNGDDNDDGGDDNGDGGDDNGDDGIDDSGDSDDDSTGDDDGGGATSGGGPTSGGGASSGGGGTGFGGGGGAAAADPSAEEPAVEDPLTGPVTSGGALPAPSAGSAEVIVDGTTSLATTSASLDTLAVNGGGVSADLAATDSRGTPSPVRGGVMNLPPGGRITVAGTGLDPGASAVVWLLSDPVRLGTATVAGDGALRTTFTVPRTVPTGPHTLQLVLPTTDGAPVALSLGVAVGPVTSRFPDVAVGGTHWLAIEQLVAWEVTRGSRTGTYDPWRPVTRGQMATFLTRLLDLAPTGRSSFPDTAASTHERGILAVADAGIAGGFTDGTFRPEATLTRGQLATFLLRAAELEPRASGTATDVAGTTHERAIHAVMAAGIAGGFPDGTYRPNDPVARAQMATLLVGLESQISR